MNKTILYSQIPECLIFCITSCIRIILKFSLHSEMRLSVSTTFCKCVSKAYIEACGVKKSLLN